MEYNWEAPSGKNSARRDARINYVRNAWEPIAIPRWALSLKYAMFVVVGILTFIAGQPTLSLTTFNGYEPIWAAFVALGGVIGVIGSARPKWGYLEAIGGTTIVAFLAVLIAALFYRDSIIVGILLAIVCIIPAVRAAFLITHYSFKRKGMIG